MRLRIEEVAERWKRDFPESLVDAAPRALRTKHFILIGDGVAMKKYGAILEDHYKRFSKALDLESRDDRRLLPVYFFKRKEDFVQYSVDHRRDRASAESEGAYVWGGSLATYEGVGDGSALTYYSALFLLKYYAFLDGGGTWFTTGIAQYIGAMADTELHRRHQSFCARAVRDGNYVSFDEFVCRQSLTVPTVSSAGVQQIESSEAYQQAGTMIESVLHGKATSKKAQEFIYAVGLAPRNDLQALERILRYLWDVDIERFEGMYLEYCKKPAKKL